MSKKELEHLIAFHQKQAELNKGKEHAARTRREFHEATLRSLALIKVNG